MYDLPLTYRSPVVPCVKPGLVLRRTKVYSTKYNPQNTDQPLILPNPSLDAIETVKVQLNALQNCNDPWPNHGIQLAYEFGYDVGGLDPSMYFGYPSDLYHLDHFMGKFQNKLPDLVNSSSFEILDDIQSVIIPHDSDKVDATWIVEAVIVNQTKSSQTHVRFHLRMKRVGSRKGSLMTYMVEKL
jgi:hypothetical protein